VLARSYHSYKYQIHKKEGNHHAGYSLSLALDLLFAARCPNFEALERNVSQPSEQLLVDFLYFVAPVFNGLSEKTLDGPEGVKIGGLGLIGIKAYLARAFENVFIQDNIGIELTIAELGFALRFGGIGILLHIKALKKKLPVGILFIVVVERGFDVFSQCF
jgi:hypothetical protein